MDGKIFAAVLVLIILIFLKRIIKLYFIFGAESGHTDTQRKLGLFYIHGESYFPEDHFKAEIWLKKAAESGDVEAAFILGNLYGLDSSPVHDYSKSAFWLQKAALSDYPDAQFMLALMYRDGVGVEKDNIKSLELFILAAENGQSSIDMDELKAEMSLESIEKATRLAETARNIR